ncbi:carboxylate--amine ligase [Halorubrum kocurii]|uniref:ATP-grasp protein-like protein n=1 Tax=Halorubrum kocurii JCM 14978 TaxID=1230456 RepID=M0P7L4_9EURY|nr:ATP-grasp domain-containing protein [Halorubrum kocurii]EMA65524.1 ATP-grasp protein-like protein [Halorubrum kocurii JCM 14978]
MTDDRPAAVVPAIGTQSSVVAVRSLARAGVAPVLASDGQRSPALSSKHCAEVVDVPDPTASMRGYADAFVDLAARDDVITILPLREADAYALASRRRELSEHLDPVWPGFDALRSAQDRRTLLSVAADLGVPVPRTRLLTDWPADDDGPLVVKPRYTILVDEDGRGSREPDVRLLDAGERPPVESVVDEMGHVPVTQEFVPSDGEYGFFALMDRGEPVATFQHHRIRSFTYTGGASVYREAVDIDALREHGTALLSALDWHGPAMVEFRRDARDGSFRLMEINPRFWGSLALPVHAGVDFPRHYAALSLGQRPDPAAVEYEVGVGSHLLSGELAYLYNVLRADGHGDPPPIGGEVAALATSLYRNPNFDLFSTDDPLPFAAAAAGMAATLGSRVADAVRR